MGPGGPLVRFDRSPPPPSSSGRTEAGLRRSTPANGGSSRGPEGGDGSARPGRSSRWSRRWRGRRESPAASAAVDGGFGRIWGLGYGGSRSSLRGGVAPQGLGESNGGAGWTGEVLLATQGTGARGGRTVRRRGRRPFPVDCWLRECYGGGLGSPECSEELGAAFYSATRLVPAVVDKNDGESPFCSGQGDVAATSTSRRA